MKHILQGLRRIFRRKPPRRMICGNVLFDMTPEQRERYLAECKGESHGQRPGNGAKDAP